jgi:hypothetical protein
MRRALQEGQTPRPLQEKATRRSAAQSSQRARAKPRARMPRGGRSGSRPRPTPSYPRPRDRPRRPGTSRGRAGRWGRGAWPWDVGGDRRRSDRVARQSPAAGEAARAARPRRFGGARRWAWAGRLCLRLAPPWRNATTRRAASTAVRSARAGACRQRNRETGESIHFPGGVATHPQSSTSRDRGGPMETVRGSFCKRTFAPAKRARLKR